jgi:hypothetical protein
MRSRIPLVTLLGTLSIAACAATADDTLIAQSTLFVDGPVSAGATATAVFRNSTGADVAVGDIGCVLDIQRSEHGGWQPVKSDRVCGSFSRVVPAGDSLTFAFATPVTPGIYRIHASGAVWTPPPTGQSALPEGIAELVSPPFVTTP